VQRSTRVIAALTLFIVLLAFAPFGRAQGNSRVYEFNVPRMRVADFFGAISTQTDTQFGYSPTDAEEEATLIGPLRGRYTVDAAITEALAQTGFTFAWANERTISIISPPVITLPLLPPGTISLVEESAPHSNEETYEQARKRLEGILVMASRIANLDSLQTPSLVADRRDLDALGVSTLPEALRYISSLPYLRSELSNTGDQRVELRGLGSDTTLVLINGRRVGSSSVSWGIEAFDLNTIPLAAVERVEVTLDSPPLAVGADAIGGVVNIVLKSDTKDPVAEVRYGLAAGGAGERRASVTAGHANEQLRFSTVLDLFKRDELLGEERDRWRNQDYRRFGSIDFRSQAASPGNVASLTSQNLPGLSSRFAAVPSRPPGESLTIEDFETTAGQRNFDSLRRFRSLVPDRERISAVGSLEWAPSSDALAFAELLYADGRAQMHEIPFALTNVVVPATNPFNPFGVPVAVSFLPTSVGAREWTTDNTFLRSLAGIQARWSRWSFELSALYTEDVTRIVQENELVPARVSAALAESDPALALNVFDDGPGGSAQLLRSLIADPIVWRASSHLMQGAASARGPVLRLPGGDISGHLGAEWHRSAMSAETQFLGAHERTIKGAFLELGVPLVNAEMRVPGISQLAFSASGRIDDFSDVGSIENSRYALTWHPTNGLSARAAYGTTFRPPSLFELNRPAIHVPVVVFDVRRNNELANIVATTSGNPDLAPARAHSWSLGLFYDRRDPIDFNASATYWRTHLQDRVSPLTVTTLLLHDDLFPDRVTRAAPSATDLAAGLPGVLTALDGRPVNVGTLRASGIDGALSAAFDTRLGRIAPSVSATWMDEFTVVDVPGLPPIERVGLANFLGTIPDWYAIGTIDWSGKALSATTTARFVSAYRDFNPLTDRPNGRRVPSQLIVDVQASLLLDRFVEANSPLLGLRISAGITNVFDKRAPFAEVGFDQGYDTSQGDLKGRFGYIRLTKAF
jgi:iron complex outermembrane recepter protein